MSEPGEKPLLMGWSELMTPHASAAAGFYAGLFGWPVEAKDFGTMTYSFFKLGEQRVGGMVQLTEDMSPVPPHWMSYVSVEDVDAAAGLARGPGGFLPAPPDKRFTPRVFSP